MTRLLVASSHSAVLPRDLMAGVRWCSAVLFVRKPTAADEWPPLLTDLGSVVDVPDSVSVPWGELRRFRPDGVVTFSEDLLDLSAEMAHVLGLPHVSVPTVDIIRNKALQRAELRRAGVDRTRSALVSSSGELVDALKSLGLPAVVKPAYGAGSAATTLARSVESAVEKADDFFARWPTRSLVLEEYLVGRDDLPFGDYVSIESVLCPGGEVRHLGVTGKFPLLPPFRETGQFYPAGLPDDVEREVLSLTSSAIDALGVDHGAVHTEVKLTPDGPRIIEVNARVGGYVSELYSRVLSVDVVDLLTRLACGQTVHIPEPRLPPGCPTLCSQVHFQYTHQPPPEATRLTGIDGVGRVSRHPSVSRYERLTRVGASLPQDQRTHDLDLICGSAPSHADLLNVLDDVRSTLTFHFDTTDGPVKMTGSQLDDLSRLVSKVAPGNTRMPAENA